MVSAAHSFEFQNQTDQRFLHVVGSLDENVDQLQAAVIAISEGWVSDDIIVDLRDASGGNPDAIAKLVGAGTHARALGHRVVVHAQDDVANALDEAALSGALVVIN